MKVKYLRQMLKGYDGDMEVIIIDSDQEVMPMPFDIIEIKISKAIDLNKEHFFYPKIDTSKYAEFVDITLTPKYD